MINAVCQKGSLFPIRQKYAKGPVRTIVHSYQLGVLQTETIYHGDDPSEKKVQKNCLGEGEKSLFLLLLSSPTDFAFATPRR